MSSLDKSLKNSLGGIDAQFSEGDWSAMENMLDARDKRAAALPFRIAGLAVITVLTGFSAWYLVNQQPWNAQREVVRAIVAPAPSGISGVLPFHTANPSDGFVAYSGITPSTPVAPRQSNALAPETTIQRSETRPQLVAAKLDYLSPEAIKSHYESVRLASVWELEMRKARPDWRIHTEGGPGLTLSSPSRLAQRMGAAVSMEFVKGYRLVAGLALSKFSLPGSGDLSESFVAIPTAGFREAKFSQAEVSFNFEHDFSSSGRLKPFVYVGTSVFIPLKETYEYGDPPPATPTFANTSSLTYNTMDAGNKPLLNGALSQMDAPEYQLSPHFGIVQAGVGLSYELTPTTALTGKAQLQKALNPIGLEDQNFFALSTQAGLRFNL